MNATFENFTSNSTEYSDPLTYGSSVYTIAVFSWVVYAIVFGVGGVLDIFVLFYEVDNYAKILPAFYFFIYL